MRRFNTAGPVRPDDHYAIPPLDRMDVEELLELIHDKQYFVLHAPRQTGKTSALIALRDLLNCGAAGRFRWVDVNVEVAQVARDDVVEGLRAVLSSLAMSAQLLGDDYEEAVFAAREELILSRRTHLDQLAHKLEEERVRRVVEPILSGGEARHQVRDLEYLRDLGLIDGGEPPRIANPIYAEVAPRELGYILQSSLDEQTAWYVDDAGRLDMTKLLAAFGTFYAEHAEHWLGRFSEYPEAGPQLILQAYLQRVVNSGGRIEREYGLGRGRTDLLVLWPREPGQSSDLWERIVVECKVLRDSDRKSLEWTVEHGVEQTSGYMAKCGVEEGHLVVFDGRSGTEERRCGEAGHRAEANTGRTAARCSSASCRALGNGCRPAPSSCASSHRDCPTTSCASTTSAPSRETTT